MADLCERFETGVRRAKGDYEGFLAEEAYEGLTAAVETLTRAAEALGSGDLPELLRQTDKAQSLAKMVNGFGYQLARERRAKSKKKGA